jgi:hypothetical protein
MRPLPTPKLPEAGKEDKVRHRTCRTESRCMTPNRVLPEPEMQPLHETLDYRTPVTMLVNSSNPVAPIQNLGRFHHHQYHPL